MKTVLINCPQTYLLDPQRNPSLGLMYVAASAERMGHNIQLVNLSAEKEQADFLRIIPEADIYGFSVSVMDYRFSIELARKLKKRNKCFVIFGGSLPTAAPEYIDSDAVNSIIVGEGEKSFLTLLDSISRKKRLPKIYRASRIKDLDSVEFPLRKGIKFISNRLLEENVPATTIIASRGCPFNCAFCANISIWGRDVNFRSAENVLDETDFLIKNYRIRGLKFLDDTLMLHPGQFKKICAGLKKREILWRCSTRSNLITGKSAKIMRDSGCKEVGIGVESADPAILEFINKKVTTEEHEQAIKILKDAGIRVSCFFITGLPGETEDTPELNIAFLKKTSPSRVFCTTFMPYPGTDIWNNPDKYNIRIITRDLSKYNQVSGIGEGDREFVAIPSGLTYSQLFNNRKKIIGWLAQENKIEKRIAPEKR